MHPVRAETIDRKLRDLCSTGDLYLLSGIVGGPIGGTATKEVGSGIAGATVPQVLVCCQDFYFWWAQRLIASAIAFYFLHQWCRYYYRLHRAGVFVIGLADWDHAADDKFPALKAALMNL